MEVEKANLECALCGDESESVVHVLWNFGNIRVTRSVWGLYKTDI